MTLLHALNTHGSCAKRRNRATPEPRDGGSLIYEKSREHEAPAQIIAAYSLPS